MRAACLAVLLAATVAAPAAAAEFGARYLLTSGPAAGEEVVVRFTVDDALLSSDFADYFEPNGLGLLELGVEAPGIPGFAFDLSNADAYYLAFQWNQLVDFAIGGAPSGFDEIDALNNADADFIADSFAFGYKLAGEGQFIFEGELISAQTPAPAALALFGLGVAALGLARRR